MPTSEKRTYREGKKALGEEEIHCANSGQKKKKDYKNEKTLWGSYEPPPQKKNDKKQFCEREKLVRRFQNTQNRRGGTSENEIQCLLTKW